MALEKRVTRQRFRDFLAKRYKDTLAGKLLQIIADKFGNFVANIDESGYILGVESIFN